MPSLTEQFDLQLNKLVNTDRQAIYGHPLDDFAKAQLIKQSVASCDRAELRHCLEQIGVKMARLCNTPGHLDSWIDIAGYARCAVMILDEIEARDTYRKQQARNLRG